MTISIKAELLKKIYETKGNILSLSWSVERQIKEELDSNDGYRPDDAIAVDLVDYNIEQLKKIHSLLSENQAPPKTIDTIVRWMQVLKDPMNGDVTSLQGFQKVFQTLIKQLKDKWLFLEREDGEMCPVLITKSKYYSRSRDDIEHFVINAEYGYLFNIDNDSTKSYSTDSKTFYFYKSSLFGGDDSEYFFIDGSFEYNKEEDDGDEEKKPKKAKAAKKESVKLAEILSKEGLYLPTPELYDKYKLQIAKLNSLYSLNGTQFTVNGRGYELDDSYRSLRYKLTAMEDEGDFNKVVIDNNRTLTNIKRTSECEGLGSMPLPYHPYIKMYDITKYRSVMIHVDKLVPYVYNIQIVDSLILPESNKKLLNSLIGGETNFDDIVSGKSGGIIILGSGSAGTGKTLTAEIYSEVVKKPLYQIQSSQLGLEPKSIEENLRKILRRADRWNAVLLIDECDAYVFKRGENMVQNAVVGVFLRLLEYYKGILFLTTNRHDMIDGAIMSRLTAHIKYGVPTTEHQLQILGMLSKRFNITISEAEQKKILELYPLMVGRDIRNLLKLIKKYYHKEKGNIKLTATMLEEVKEFIPFV